MPRSWFIASSLNYYVRPWPYLRKRTQDFELKAMFFLDYGFGNFFVFWEFLLDSRQTFWISWVEGI